MRRSRAQNKQPVPLFICFGKSVSWNGVTDTAMIQFMLDCNEAGLNVAKTVLRSILRKAHHEKLVVAGKVPGTIISLVSGDTSIEVSARYERHKLSKYGWSVQNYDSSRVQEKTFVIN